MGTGKGPFTPGPRVSGLSAKLQDRTARVGVIGLGYVGLPLAAFVRQGRVACDGV